MKEILFSLLAIALSGIHAFSQENEKHAYKLSNYFDFAISVSGGNFASALSWSHLHDIGQKQKFQIGYGLRYTNFLAANKYYTTAPARFTSPIQNIGTIFSRTIAENIDTLTTTTGVTNSINLAIYLQYQLSAKVDIGFNIDAVGFSFGGEKQFNVISSSYDANQSPVQSGRPTRFNLLLTSDNDIGSLNSEFYIRYWLTPKFGLRAGYTFLFSEYQTHPDLSFNHGQIMNDRYRYKARMALLAITYKPFN
jgi:hypothetical protein